MPESLIDIKRRKMAEMQEAWQDFLLVWGTSHATQLQILRERGWQWRKKRKAELGLGVGAYKRTIHTLADIC